MVLAYLKNEEGEWVSVPEIVKCQRLRMYDKITDLTNTLETKFLHLLPAGILRPGQNW